MEIRILRYAQNDKIIFILRGALMQSEHDGFQRNLSRTAIRELESRDGDEEVWISIWIELMAPTTIECSNIKM